MSMNLDHQLPFRVEQEAESKSFAVGYRSAWFRCKIKSISFRKRQIWYSLEFFDFPDEKIRWTKVYQKPPHQPDQARRKSKLPLHQPDQVELMVRPPFPPFFRKSQLPKVFSTSDVIAIINDTWKVGDLVDWWYDSCYWSGRVSQLLEDDKVLIDLPEPPIGEGRSYVALCKDLRPSLDWTPENGWTVPVSKEHGKFCSCAQLIHRNNHETINTGMDIQCDGSLGGKPNCSYTASDELSDRSSVPAEAPSRGDQASPVDSTEKIHISGSDHVTLAKDAVGIMRKMMLDHSDSPERISIGEMDMQCDGSLGGKPNCSDTASDELSDRSSVPAEAPTREDQSSPVDSAEKIHISGSDHAATTKDAIGTVRKMQLDHLDSPERIWIGELDMRCDGSLGGKPYTASDELSDRSSVPTAAPSREDEASPMDSVKKTHISGSNHVTSTKDAVGMVRKKPPARDHLDSLERIWIDETNYTASSKFPDSIESSIIQLEVLTQKIKWLKGLLKFGFEWSNAMKPSWKFVENCASLK